MKKGVEDSTLPPVVQTAPANKKGEELFLTNETGRKFYYWSEALGSYSIGQFTFQVTEHFMLRYLERFSPKSSPDRNKITSILKQLLDSGWLLDERLVRSGLTMRTHNQPGFYLANRGYLLSFTVEKGICVTQTIYRSGTSVWYQNWLHYTEKIYRERAQTSKPLRDALEKEKKELAYG